jgi:hypothetical protein
MLYLGVWSHLEAALWRDAFNTMRNYSNWNKHFMDKCAIHLKINTAYWRWCIERFRSETSIVPLC